MLESGDNNNRNRYRKIETYIVIIFILFLIISLHIILFFYIVQNLKISNGPDEYEFFIYLDLEGNESYYEVYIPLPDTDRIPLDFENALHIPRFREAVDFDHHDNFSLIERETTYGRTLIVSSNQSLLLRSYVYLHEQLDYDPAFSTQNDNRTFIFLNKTDSNTNLSISIIFLQQRYPKDWREYDFYDVKYVSVSATDIQPSSQEILDISFEERYRYINWVLRETPPIELETGWNEYEVFEGKYRIWS